MTWFPRIVVGCAAAALAVRLAWPDQRLTVTAFDIGQGDAVLVQCGTQQMLVDGGPDDAVMAKLGTAMPFFDRTIENIVLTHPHADHYFGLTAVLRRYDVERVFLSGDDGGGADYRDFLAALEAGGAERVVVHVGDVISLGDCAAAEVLWPDQTHATAHKNDDLNTQSVVLRVARTDARNPRAAVLLTGDANDEVEEALLQQGAHLAADLLKVGHHGSKSSSSPAFLDAVRPAYAVISAAAKNKFGHPTPEALARLKERDAVTFRTDQLGNVRFVITPDEIIPPEP